MAARRKICIVTGSRAEYGLLSSLMREIRKDPSMELQVACTGMHLSPEFGSTYREIEKDGFRIDAKVDALLSNDQPAAIAKSIGLGTLGFADAFERLKPNLVVVLGDRFEIWAAAQAALVHRIPLAHIHGGEVTEGAIDDPIRHSITKMAHLHFVTADDHRRRVLQLGEAPEFVFNVGAPGLDVIQSLIENGRLLTTEELSREIGFDLSPRFLLLTYHPVTLGERCSEDSLRQLFDALDELNDFKLLFTQPNADAHGRVLIQMIENYCQDHPRRATCMTSMGQRFYLSAMRGASAVVGNSSSALIEAPYLKVPAVNLGDRQQGRLCGANVIDCTEEAASILTAMMKAISPEFREKIRYAPSPYGEPGATVKIKSIIASVDLNRLHRKRFVDWQEGKAQ